MKSIRLGQGKERSLLRRHPWVFQGSVAKGKADAGETVRIEAHDGRFLAWGAYSGSSTIRVRAWSFDEAERIDHAFFKRRVARALALRERLAIFPEISDGVRLVHGEADGLPGLIVDRYGATLSAQATLTRLSGHTRHCDARSVSTAPTRPVGPSTSLRDTATRTLPTRARQPRQRSTNCARWTC
jgi:23S rRNA G2069 N7-methylase RlmK/C1962 C5-methylase RlmI